MNHLKCENEWVHSLYCFAMPELFTFMAKRRAAKSETEEEKSINVS